MPLLRRLALVLIEVLGSDDVEVEALRVVMPWQVLRVKERVEVRVVVRQLLEVQLVIEVLVIRHVELRHALVPVPLLPGLSVLLFMVIHASHH